MTKKYLSTSPEETQAIAQGLALRIGSGGVIALTGDLGAGKTVFVKGLGRGLGITKVIQSPTFVLMKVYRVQHRTLDIFVHVDCYRLVSMRELQDIGVDDYLRNPKALIVIEWAEKAKNLPTPYGIVRVTLKPRSDHNREIIIQAARQYFLDVEYTDRRGRGRDFRASGRSRY